MTSHPTDPEIRDDGTVISAIDWLGRRFRVGEQVLYCIGAGRGQMMALGEVKQITVEKKGGYRHARDGEEATHVSHLGHFVFDPEIGEEIKVQVLTKKTSGRWGSSERSRPAWVNPMNITAIPQ